MMISVCACVRMRERGDPGNGLLARQAGIINQLMGDASPAVRASAVEGICRILNTFWELIPAPTTAAFLAKLAGRGPTHPHGCIKPQPQP